MGQQVSSDFSSIFRQTQTLRELTTLTYDELLDKVKELNEISQSLTYDKKGRLSFEVRCPSETPVLWKKQVRICCKRLRSNKTQSARFLSLRQFLQAYHTIKAYSVAGASTPAQGSSGGSVAKGATTQDISASAMFDGVLGTSESDLEECCVCMERKPEVTLPCTHSYCLVCIEQWNVSNTTCPLCREEFETTDETWVISEAPESSEVLSEMQKALVEISEWHSGDGANSSGS